MYNTTISYSVLLSNLVLRQEHGNNLCEYYVCEYIHHHSGNTDDDSVSKINLLIKHHLLVVLYQPICKLLKIIKRDALIEKNRLLAIQEALMGFLMDEAVNPQGKHHYENNPID
jgi:hypothetical protein